MRLLRHLAAVAAFAPMLGLAPASAQDKQIELKLAHWVPPSHPLQKAMEEWGTSISKATNGTVTFKVFPSQQLGKAFDHYDMARDGIADVTYINPGYQPGRFPIIGAGELPFLMADAKGGSQALDAWYRKYADKEMKDVRFCLGFVHDPGAIHSKTKKVMVPGDIRGMKIRPAHATIAAFVTQLGGTNVQGVRAGGPRHAGEGRRRRGHVPVGLGAAVRHRQGHQVPHGGAALRHHLRLGDEQEHLQQHVGRRRRRRSTITATTIGRCGGRPVGRLRARRHPEAEIRSGARGLHHLDRAGGRVAQGRRAAAGGMGRRRAQGGRRPRRDHWRAEGVGGASTTRPTDRGRTVRPKRRRRATSPPLLRWTAPLGGRDLGDSACHATPWIASSTASSLPPRSSSASSPPTCSSR